MTHRIESVAVADLIPGDILIPRGWVVDHYPRPLGKGTGTLVPWVRRNGSEVPMYYADPEEIVRIVR